jgi:hypothetical protein
MDLQRCPNGHFYDAEKFSACPHCGGHLKNDVMTQAMGRDMSKTVGLTPGDLGDKPTAKTNSDVQADLSGVMNLIQPGGAGDDGKTVSFYAKKVGTEPVVGWLVCIEGKHFGKDFRLKSGKNFIGRSREMDVSLAEDDSVSRDRHAIVVYEPKKHLYLAQPGEAKELFYLNDQVVLSTTEMKYRDVLTVGDSVLMFFPCCDDEFNWNTAKKEE